MQLGEAVYMALSGGVPPREVDNLPDALRTLQGADSVAATARAFGVPPSTWRRWARGARARADVSWLIDSANREERRQNLSRGREQSMRRAWSLDSIVITATYHYSRGGTMKGTEEGRTIALGEYLNDVSDDLVDAYLDGESAEQLGEIMASAINDHGWYASTFNEEGDGAWDIHSFEGWG